MVETRILIAGRIPEWAADELRRSCDVECYPQITYDDLVAATAAFAPSILVVRTARVDERLLRSTERLSLVVRLGAGHENIDLDACRRLRTTVATCPGQNAAAVAELAWGLIIAIDRQITENINTSRLQRWQRTTFLRSRGLRGHTLGIAGLGAVGREMVPRASAFGMRVIAWNRGNRDSISGPDVAFSASLEDLAASCDIVSLHIALTAETTGIIGSTVLSRMRDNAILINTARPALVERSSLETALTQRGLRYGVDGWYSEPSTDSVMDDPLLQHSQVYVTQHVGGATAQADDATATRALQIIREHTATGTVQHRLV